MEGVITAYGGVVGGAPPNLLSATLATALALLLGLSLLLLLRLPLLLGLSLLLPLLLGLTLLLGASSSLPLTTHLRSGLYYCCGGVHLYIITRDFNFLFWILDPGSLRSACEGDTCEGTPVRGHP